MYSNWDPIGSGLSMSTCFYGNYNGNGYKITNLTINRPSNDYVGLVSYVYWPGTLSNMRVEGANVTGASFTGILVGH